MPRPFGARATPIPARRGAPQARSRSYATTLQRRRGSRRRLAYSALRRYMLRQSSCHDQGSLHVRRRPRSSTGRKIASQALIHAYAMPPARRHWIIPLRNEAGLLAAALSDKKRLGGNRLPERVSRSWFVPMLIAPTAMFLQQTFASVKGASRG